MLALLCCVPLVACADDPPPPRPGVDFDPFTVKECDWLPCNAISPLWINISRSVETKSWPLATAGTIGAVSACKRWIVFCH